MADFRDSLLSFDVTECEAGALSAYAILIRLMTFLSLVPVRLSEMAAIARMLGSRSSNSLSKASTEQLVTEIYLRRRQMQVSCTLCMYVCIYVIVYIITNNGIQIK